WYYRFDRTNNRKCWYLVPAAAARPDAAADASPVSPAPAAAQSGISNWLSSVLRPAAAQGEGAREPRIIQPNPNEPLRLEDALQLRRVQRPKTEDAAAPAPQAPAPKQAAASRPGYSLQGNTAHLSRAERDALFQEYLEWRRRNGN